MNWWQRLRHRDRMERELHAELRFHFDRLVEDHVRTGLSRREARRAARLEFGGVDQVEEACRDARGTRWVHDLWQDVRFAVRLLARERGLTITAVFALALGIGVNNTLFSVVNALCLRGLPIDRPDRMVYLSSRDAKDRDQPLTPIELDALRAGLESASDIAAFTSMPSALADDGLAADRVVVGYVSGNVGALLGRQPILGRSFVADDDRVGARPVVILGGDVWSSRYGSDPAVLGRMVRLNGVPATVIGVMPAGLRFPENADVWQPLAAAPALRAQGNKAPSTGSGQAPSTSSGQARVLGAMARLRDGASLADTRGEVGAVSARLTPGSSNTASGTRLRAVPIKERFNGDITNPAWIAFITVGALLVIIACANVANLLLSRSVRRSREIAIRLALGATRIRIVRQLLAESLVLATLGGMAGLGLSMIGLRIFASAIPENGLPFWVTLTMDARVLVMLAGVCLGTVALFGMAPALHLSKATVNDVLKEGGAAAAGGARASRWTAVILTAEFAFTVILLAAVGASVREFFESEPPAVEIETSGLLTAAVALPPDRYPSAADRMRVYDGLTERLRGKAALASASLASALPFGRTSQRYVTVAGRAALKTGEVPSVPAVLVDPRYFETLGVPVVRGHAFDDDAGGRGTVIVNQSFAQVFLPDMDPIGQRIQLSAEPTPGATDAWRTVVGVAPALSTGPDPLQEALVYLPFREAAPATAAIMVRAIGDARAVAPMLREEMKAIDADLPLYRVMTLRQVRWEAGWNPRLSSRLIMVIASIALGLSALGLCAVTAHAVAQRTHEIGIRMALGARPRQVMMLVLRRALLQVIAGFAAGVVLTFIWERLLSSEGTLTGIVNLSTVAVMLIVVAMGACLWPARRAARLDPLAALRHQ